MDSCRSCGAEIEWGVTAKGRRIPLDPVGSRVPDDTLNVRTVGRWKDGTYAVEIVEPGRGETLSHFATCPEASSHRRRR